MKYWPLVLLLLAGCSLNMMAIDRDTGEQITIYYEENPITDANTLTATIDGETFTGKMIETNVATMRIEHSYYGISSDTYKALLVGDRNRTMRCDVCGKASGGIGTCITSDGKVYDITW